MPAIKKTLWLLPKSFLPLPLAGLEPARCYPLDFESSASANSATAAHEPIIILTQKTEFCKKNFKDAVL